METKEKLLEEKLEELATYKAKSEVLGTELSTAKRHLATNAKATASSRSEFQRLNKVEAAYSKVMDDILEARQANGVFNAHNKANGRLL